MKKMSKVLVNKKLYTLARAALLSAVAVVLSIFESFIPDLPFALPGMKLGLGNIAVLLAVETCPLGLVLYVAAVRALFALVTRGATAFFMSFAGAIASSLLMYFLARIKNTPFGCVGIGIAGAFAHNTAQIFTAYFIIGNAVWGYFPVVTLFALVSGSLTSLVHFFALPKVTSVPLFQ